MKNSVGRGALILIISGLICKFFGAMFRLPLTNILGLQGIGVFQMVMSLYSLTLGFVSGGVTNSLSKLVSSARARGDYKKIGGHFRYALYFSLGLSVFFGVFFLLFSRSIASLQGYSGASISYMLLSLLLPMGALIGTFRGIIQGYENMTPTAISQIIEQVVKFAFGLIFAYFFGRRGIGAGVFGAFLGITLSEVLALLFLVFVIKKKGVKPSDAPVRKEFFKAVLPLTVSSSTLPLANAIEALIIISLLSFAGLSNEVATTLYGLQSGVAGAILHFPLIISLAVASAMLPKISFLSAKDDYLGQQRIINKTFNIMWFLLIPLILGIIAISRELYPIIYPSVVDSYLDIAFQLTFLGGIAIILSAFMQFLNSILQAKGYYNYSLLFNVVGALGKILSIVIFAPIPQINIFAIPISNIVVFSIICICALIKLGALIKVSFFGFALPLLSAVIMFMVVKLWLSFLAGTLGVLIGVVLGGIVYLLLCLPLVFEYGRLIKNYKEA